MRIKVLLFAGLRESMGVSQLELELPDSSTIGDAVASLKGDHAAISEGSFMTARNEAYASPETVLMDGDELALIPPVSGG